MRLIQRLALLVPIVILWTACTTKQEAKPPTLEGLVDKRVKPIYDSLTAIKDKKIRDGFLPILRQLVQEYPYNKDSATHALLQLELATLHNSRGHFDSAISCSQDALIYFESHPEGQASLTKCYATLGMNMRNAHQNIFLANRYCTKAASLSLLPGMDTLIPLDRRVQLLYVAATTNLHCEQNEQALYFARLGHRLLTDNPDSCKNPFTHYRAATILFDAFAMNGPDDSTKKYLAISEQVIRQWKFPDSSSKINHLKATYFMNTGQADSSLKYLLLTDGFEAFSAESLKLKYYCLLGKKQEAIQAYQNIAQTEQEDSTYDNGSSEYAESKTLFLILFGDRKTAATSFLKYDSLTGNAYDKERLDMFSSIEPEYNLADKQKRLDRLGKANKAAEDELRHKNTLLLVSVLVILLVSVTVIALLLLARQRKLRSEKKILETERNKIELEQRLLRTQMEPHFIFNTLSVLQSQIHNQETDRASTYLNHFARLLRTSLENSRENFVPLQEEIEALEAYLSLQQMRFEHAFDYDIQLYPGFEDDDVQILPMLLQPFVENAIQYGRGSADRRLHIVVSVYAKDDVLYCSIENNGNRVEETPAKAKKKSLSTQIIRERLAIVSRQTGKEARLTVQDTEILGDAGTRVTIVFPLLTEAAVRQLKDGVAV